MKLWEMIDALKEHGFITDSLKETAHEIRYFGNYGSHFQDDGLDEVSNEEAVEIRSFAGQLLSLIYIMPHKTGEMRKKRDKRKQVS